MTRVSRGGFHGEAIPHGADLRAEASREQPLFPRKPQVSERADCFGISRQSGDQTGAVFAPLSLSELSGANLRTSLSRSCQSVSTTAWITNTEIGGAGKIRCPLLIPSFLDEILSLHIAMQVERLKHAIQCSTAGLLLLCNDNFTHGPLWKADLV